MYVNRMKAHGPVPLANGQNVTINHVDHTQQTQFERMETRSINHMGCSTSLTVVLFLFFLSFY